MRKLLLFLPVLFLIATSSQAQTAINTDGSAPDANTMLHVKHASWRSILGIRGGGSGITLGTTESIRGDNTDGPGVAGTSSSFSGIYGTSSSSHGVWGVSVTTSMAGVLGRNDVTGGYGVWGQSSGSGIGVYGTSTTGNAGQFDITNTTSTGDGIRIGQSGLGRGIYSVINNTSNIVAALRGETNGIGYGVFGQATGNGNAGFFQISNPASTSSIMNVSGNHIGSGITIQLTNASNGSRGLDVLQAGVGPGVFSTSAGGNAVWGITSSISAAGVIGDNTFGEAVVGRNRGGNGVGAVVGRNDSSGYGVRGFNTKNGIGVLGQTGISGGTGGSGGWFENVNAANNGNVLVATGNGGGYSLLVNNAGTVSVSLAAFQKNGINVARIDEAGVGYFNGGTQNSGADVAEMFDVTGNKTEYEPGDVLSISTTSDRTVEKSAGPYSTLVAGVYATKPGVTLTEDHIDVSQDAKVPMGVIGVIPTKVCLEGGEIKRGDLLVTSSIPGVAMKGDLDKIKPGQVIGKALQDYSGKEVGKVKVLVSIK